MISHVGVRRFTRFCPGACGSPFRVEFFFAARTSSSRRVFGTARTARMTSLKCWNSGVESNGSAFILSPLVCGVSFRVPAVSEEEVVSSILLVLAGQLFVGNSASNDLFHYSNEAFRIGGLTVVVSECLFIDKSEQGERIHADVRAVQAAFQEAPETRPARHVHQ